MKGLVWVNDWGWVKMYNIRKFRYTSESYANLRHNGAHQFAARHALTHYVSSTVYTFIPKNACTTMRLSLAMANGMISEKSDWQWVHSNNDTFIASQGDLVTANYSFVILRCPFARLASVFMDKIVSMMPPFWGLHKFSKEGFEPTELSFAEFVNWISNPGGPRLDIHWRPQLDFLVYSEYDDWFSLENFKEVTQVVQSRLGIDVVDARAYSKHGSDNMCLVENRDFSSTPIFEILSMKRDGHLPAHSTLYTEEIVNTVSRLYQADIILYKQRFGASPLMNSLGV